MRVVMREFRFLDEKRKLGGLTPVEEQRWVDLKADLGVADGPSAGHAGYADGQVSADMGRGQAQGYYATDGNWYPYPEGYDPAQGYPGAEGGAADPNAPFDPTAMGAEIDANLHGDDPSHGFSAPVDSHGYAAMNDGYVAQVAAPEGGGYGDPNAYAAPPNGYDPQDGDAAQPNFAAQTDGYNAQPGYGTSNGYNDQPAQDALPGYNAQADQGYDSQPGYASAAHGYEAQPGFAPQNTGYGAQPGQAPQRAGYGNAAGGNYGGQTGQAPPGNPQGSAAFGVPRGFAAQSPGYNAQRPYPPSGPDSTPSQPARGGGFGAGVTFGTGAGFGSQPGFSRPPPATSPYGRLPSAQPSWPSQDRDESINLGNDLRDEENPKPPASAEPAEVDDSDVMEVDGDDVMSVDEPSPAQISAKPSSYKPPSSFMLPTPLKEAATTLAPPSTSAPDTSFTAPEPSHPPAEPAATAPSEWDASPGLAPELPPEPPTMAADPSESSDPSAAPSPLDAPVIDLGSADVSRTGEHQKLELGGSPDDKIAVTSATDYDGFGSVPSGDSRALELDSPPGDDAIHSGSLSEIAGNPTGEGSGYDGDAVPLATNADFISNPGLLAAGVRGAWSPEPELTDSGLDLARPAPAMALPDSGLDLARPAPALGDDLPVEEVPLEFTGEHPALAAPPSLEEEPPTREFHRALKPPLPAPLEEEPPTREFHRAIPAAARRDVPVQEPAGPSVVAAQQTPSKTSPQRLTSNAPTAHAPTFALPQPQAAAALPPLLEEEEKTVQREVPAELVRAAAIGNAPTSELLKPREPSVIVAPPVVPAIAAIAPPAPKWEDVDLGFAPPPPTVEAELDEISIEPDDEDELEIEETPAPAAGPAPDPLRAAAPAKGRTNVRSSLIKGEHRVVVHTVEGQVKRGTIRDAELSAATLVLQPQGGGAKETIPKDRIKAVFFMAAPGSRPAPLTGKKIKVTFLDGRQIAGASTDYEENVSGFFLVPADTRAHTSRIYVLSAAVKNVAVS
ncbi:MAG: DUF6982 domain-containing protein [Myxococcaceae bacterium]